jgi:deoxyribonuclease-4
MAEEKFEEPYIYAMHWEVGYHPAFLGNIYHTVKYGINYGMRSIQFFLGNPKSFKRKRVLENDVVDTIELTERFPINIFSHFPYIANLAGKAKKGHIAWAGNTEIDNKLSFTLTELEYELSVLARFNKKRSGVVIHPGSYPNRREGHLAVAKSINKINFPPGSHLLLENCAGEGNKLCRTLEELKLVFDNIQEDKKEFVKVCVDTAHLWGQGDYNLSEIKEVDRLFTDFERLIGMDKFYLLHLNDSKVPLGSKVDLHACLGTGYIWGEGFESLYHLLEKCKEHGVPMVLETHGIDMLTLSEIQPMIKF